MAFEFAGLGLQALGTGLSFLGGQQGLGQQAANAALQAQEFQEQLAFQREAAQKGISWRVADAMNAGISPLVALGAPTFNPSPIALSGDAGPQPNPMGGAASGLQGMGQDISRAALAAQTEQTRMATVLSAEKIRADTMASSGEAEKNAAQASYYRAMADKVTGANIGPSIPAPGSRHFVEGQGTPPGVVQTVPSKSISDAGGSHSVEAGLTPSVKPVQQPGGGIDPQPSLGTSVGATGETTGWTLRNRLNPPSGFHVGWDGAWYPDKGSSWWDRPFGYSRNSPQRSWPFN